MEQFKPFEVKAIAFAEMDKWGLIGSGWKFKIDNNPKRRLGQCRYTSKEISVSLLRIMHDSKEAVINTLRHEIAHALHFERRGSELFERRWTGRKWSRKIPPHGREWKAIAREVGMTKEPKASSTSNISANISYKWRTVVIRNGYIEVTSGGYHRTPSVDFRKRYLKGRLHETLGNLYFACAKQIERFEQGRICPSNITFYQYGGRPANPRVNALREAA